MNRNSARTGAGELVEAEAAPELLLSNPLDPDQLVARLSAADEAHPPLRHPGAFRDQLHQRSIGPALQRRLGHPNEQTPGALAHDLVACGPGLESGPDLRRGQRSASRLSTARVSASRNAR